MCLGIPGRIVELRDDGGFPMGVVDFGGVRREVCLSYVQADAGVGDYVIVHVGFAISKVDETEARRTFEVLREMSRLDELEWIGDVADASLAEQSGALASGGLAP
ncbi:MAG TPA: HypC/HybG/HupF family hydrogenase formation chaperone [Gemmatimonadaceae bacterium]|nr:HypC/HybG/HupF family hydrogenase formation chaperone [Gemmatimonadaceae bacterium]